MAENIKDYGGIEGDDSASACETNVQAIHDASVAADDNTVYLPTGTWYISNDAIVSGEMLQPGGGTGERGAAGLGFTGDGPTKSFLTHGQLDTDSNNRIAYKGVDHSGATWDNITYDGRWRHFDSNGYDFDAGGQWGIVFESGASGDITFNNVRIRRMGGNGVFTENGHGVDLTFDRCTFYDNGIGINQENGSHQHHLAVYADADSSVTATNCEFRLASGSMANLDGPGDGSGTFTFENCYMAGSGNQCHKLTDIGKMTARNIHYISETTELKNEYTGTPSASYFAAFVGTAGYENVVEVHDIQLDDIAGFGFRVSSDNEIAVRGGSEGPIAMNTVATNTDSLYSESLSGNDGMLTFEAPGGGGAFATAGLSVHNIDGDVSALGSSDGTIDTLHWDSADSFGNDGPVTINTLEKGGSQFSPTVPSQSDVGINSGTSTSTSDSSPATSWASPTDSDTVSGSVTVQISASDSEDSDDSLTVEYRVDGNSWTTASYNTDTGYYEDTWDTTAVSDGDHTLDARATDSAGNSSTATIGVTVDNQTTLSDEWTPRWDSTANDWDVVSGTDFEGEHALAFVGSSSDRHALSWDSVSEPSDVEVLDKFRVKDTGLLARVQLRSSGSAGNESGYWLEVESRNDAFRLGKYTDGDWATLKRFGTPKQNTFYYRRFRVEGNTLKAKVWQADQSEPSNWDVELTDGDHSSGWVGLGSYNDGATETDVVSVATGGASAEYLTSNSAPGVSWQTPTDSDTVSGSVTVQIGASDSEDSDDSLTVEYRVDGNSWTAASYNADTGYYEDTWDTTAVSDGDHTLDARATDSAGSTSTATITVTTDNTADNSAPTVDSLSLSEVETDNSDAEFDVDWQVSDSDGNLDSVELALTDGSDGSTEDSETLTVSGDTASGTTRLVALGDDGSGHSYTVDLIVTDGSGEIATDTESTSETESNGAPTIDRFSVSEANSPNPHTEITVVWNVSDSDGNLSALEIDVSDSSGTVRNLTRSLSGSKASDTDSFKIKHSDGKTFDVTLTVTDEPGKSASQTTSVTE